MIHQQSVDRILQFDPSAKIKYDKEYYVKVLDNALVELVEALQMQYFGRMKYDIEGEEKALDETFEMTSEMGEIVSVTIQTNKNMDGFGKMFSMSEEDSEKPKGNVLKVTTAHDL